MTEQGESKQMNWFTKGEQMNWFTITKKYTPEKNEKKSVMLTAHTTLRSKDCDTNTEPVVKFTFTAKFTI